MLSGCYKDVTRVLHITRIRMLQGCYQHMSHVVNYRVLSHVLRLHSNRILKVLAEKR